MPARSDASKGRSHRTNASPEAALSDDLQSQEGNEKKAKIIEQMSRSLERDIIEGRLSPGDHINENHLAETLGLSRGPVREALRALEVRGLVEIIRNRGAYVPKLSFEEALNLYEVRMGLAYVAGKLATLRISKNELVDLRRVYEDMSACIERADIEGFLEGNERFHALVFAATRNHELIKIENTMSQRLVLILRHEASNLALVRESNAQHLKVLEALEAGDRNAVALAFVRHVELGAERLVDRLRMGGSQ